MTLKTGEKAADNTALLIKIFTFTYFTIYTFLHFHILQYSCFTVFTVLLSIRDSLKGSYDVAKTNIILCIKEHYFVYLV